MTSDVEERDRAALVRFRLRLVAACALLLGLAMVQSPGLMVADTKFDLVADPAGFLDRAAYLWDAEGAFGQLQNQAYGYLWPMGPFFVLGWLADLPGWVVQRLWMALVLCVAMVGAAKLARAFGVRSDLACLLGGFAYALSPRMLTTIGPISSEAWPSALAPWVLLPLVLGSQRGSAHRAAALSALAVAMVGGVNAAATFAVLPLGALWILTRAPGPRRRTLSIWWPVFTALGTLWWLVPLFLMGGYSPPFLDFIESASTTTFPTTLFDALRGTSDWVAYLDQSWRAGNDLVQEFYLPLNSGAVLLFGLVGIKLRTSPHRLFLATGVVLGVVLVTLGHTGAVQGWFAGLMQGQLDGALAPLRNIHKFDPVVRLPLVLGLALVVDALVSRRRNARSAAGRGFSDTSASHRAVVRLNSTVLVGAAVAAVLGAALPAMAARVTPADGVVSVPGYWSEAARWLADEDTDGTALLLPGSGFGAYVWGFPRDEPMQWLASTPWAVRNAVPLAPPGNIRMLDAIEERLSQGEPSSGLATYLERAGVTHLLVRNDLAASVDVPDPVLVHQALDLSPGLRRVASFGPRIGGEAHIERDLGRILVNGGWQAEYDAIEVYRVEGGSGSAVAADDLPVVVGGPEDLLDLTDLDVVGREPTVLGVDAVRPPEEAQPLILTDGLRAAERHFGRVHDGASATLGPGDQRRLGNPTRDYQLDRDDRWSTTAVLDGARSVSASSSMSDANSSGTIQRGQLPYAAVDGEPSTAWQASGNESGGAWWQVDFDSIRAVAEVTVRAGPGRTQLVEVSTANHTTEPFRVPAGTSRTIPVGGEDTPWLRVRDASNRQGAQLTLAEVDVPALSVRRLLELPRLPAGWGNPDTIVLRAADDQRTGCVQVGEDVRCLEARQVVGEEPFSFARRLELSEAQEYAAELRVRARPGVAIEQMILQGLPVGIGASSSGVRDSRGSAVAAVDGDPGTAWIAALGDEDPVLNLNWLGQRRITGLRVRVDPDSAARMPSVMTMVWPGGRRQVRVDDEGDVRFPAVRTDRISLRITQARAAVSLNFQNQPSEVPIGISELRLRGLPLLPVALSDEAVELPCGSGPTMRINGRLVLTSVTVSPQQLYAGSELPAVLCGFTSVDLEAGLNEVSLEGSDAFVPLSLVLGDDDPWEGAVSDLEHRTDDPVNLEVVPADGEGTIVLPRNANEGWRAVQDGARLQPVIVDGWQQGWRLSGSSAAVSVVFSPDAAYGIGLLVGSVTFLLLLLVARVRDRRWPAVDADPLDERRASPVLVVSGGLVVAGLLAGWLGVAVAGIVFVAVRLAAPRAPEAGRWVTASLIVPAAVGYALRPWGSEQGWAGTWTWPHLLVVAVCAGLLAWVAADSGPAPAAPRFLRRMPGSSTNR